MASGMGSIEDVFISTIGFSNTNQTKNNDTAIFDALFSGSLSVTLLLYILVALCTAIFILIICMILCFSCQFRTISRYNSVQTTLLSKATSVSGLSGNGITSSTSSFDSKQPPYLGMLHNFNKRTTTSLSENVQTTSNSNTGINNTNRQQSNKTSTPIMSDEEMHNSLVMLTNDQSVIFGNATAKTQQSTAFYPELSCNEPFNNYKNSYACNSLPPQCFPSGLSGTSAPIMSLESTPSFTSPSDAEWLSDHRIFMRSGSTTRSSSDALFDTALGNLSSGEFPQVENTNCASFKSTTSETDPLVPKRPVMSADTSVESFGQKDHLPMDSNGHPRAWFVPLDAMCHEPIRHSIIDVSDGALLTTSQTTSSHLNLSAEHIVPDCKKQYVSEQTLVSDSEYSGQPPEDEFNKRLVCRSTAPAKERVTSWEKREYRPVIVIESRGKKISSGVSGREMYPSKSADRNVSSNRGPHTHNSAVSRIPIPTKH